MSMSLLLTLPCVRQLAALRTFFSPLHTFAMTEHFMTVVHCAQNSFQGMLQELGFLMPEVQDVGDLPGDSPEDLDEQEQVTVRLCSP